MNCRRPEKRWYPDAVEILTVPFSSESGAPEKNLTLLDDEPERPEARGRRNGSFLGVTGGASCGNGSDCVPGVCR